MTKSFHNNVDSSTYRIKLIIFDFDGTLADSFLWFKSALPLAAKKYGFSLLSPEEMEKLRSKGTREILKELNISWWKIPFIAHFMRKNMNKNCHEIKLFPEIKEMLIYLKSRGYTLALVTSNSLTNVKQIMGSELLEHFDYTECGVSLLGKKKHFRKLLKSSGLNQNEILSVGDEVRDIEAARMAGMKSMAVTWGYATKEALAAKHPEYLCQHPSDVLAVLRYPEKVEHDAERSENRDS